MKVKKIGDFVKKHKMSFFIMVSTILMIVGLSYAWLQLTLYGEKNLVFHSGTLKLNLDDNASDGITLTDTVPVSDEEGLLSTGYTFTLENTGTIDSKYEIYLDDLDIPDTETRMNDLFIKYQLTKEKEEIGYDLLNTMGENPKRLLDQGELAPKEKYTYTLKLWIASTATNEVMGTVFKGQLRVEAIQGESKGLYKKIAKEAVPDDSPSEFVTSSTGIDFSQGPSDTNGKGVYTLSSTKNNQYPVHYYRGAVTDNNIKFAGFCWKIVRTTESGGVKLIYNGEPDTDGYCTNTTGAKTQIGTSAFNSNNTSPADVGYMFGNRNDYLSQGKNMTGMNENWIYGNDIEWDGEKYILKDTMESNTANWKNDWSTIATRYRYTCLSTENSCREVAYLHMFDGSRTYCYYLNLKDGKNIEDAKHEMFANTKDSKIKQTIDQWYQENMMDYTEKLEDTVWCNDRSIDRGPLKSKDEVGDFVSFFGAEGRNYSTQKPSIECINREDEFTVSSEKGNGKLTYPVALLTADELTLAGSGRRSSNQTYLYTNSWNWTMSPLYFYYGVTYAFTSYGILGFTSTENSVGGVRVAISLAPKIEFTRGNGTATNPYVIK